MGRDNDLERIAEAVRRAENLVRESGFDPEEILAESDLEELSPKERLHFVTFIFRKLQLADALLSYEDALPDPEDPDEYFSFKTNGTLLVVYVGGSPQWHMERYGEEWKTYRFRISFSGIDDLENLENMENKGPEMQLAEVIGFIDELERADDELKSNDRYFPNPFNPFSVYRFKKNEKFVVAYRGDNPIWYLKRENDEWEMRKMSVSAESDSDSFDSIFQELAEDIDDFDDFDED